MLGFAAMAAFAISFSLEPGLLCRPGLLPGVLGCAARTHVVARAAFAMVFLLEQGPFFRPGPVPGGLGWAARVTSRHAHLAAKADFAARAVSRCAPGRR